jgi:hypothetical protein
MGGDHVKDPANSATFLFDEGCDVVVDGSGSVYVTGTFLGQADFGPITLNAAGLSDGFVAKLDSNGSFLWAKSWGGANAENGTGIAVDHAGNVVSVGDDLASITGGYTYNGFEIHSYSPTGAAMWTKSIAGWEARASSVGTDKAGNVYLCGTFEGTVDFNPDPRKTNYVTGSGNSMNGYVLELTGSGAFGWVSPFVAKTAQSPGAYVVPQDLALDPTGNIIIGGQYKGQADFNPDPKIDYRLPNIGVNYDGFVAKLSPTGALAWATPLGGASEVSVAVDAAGSVYGTGQFGGSNGPFTPGFGLPPVTGNSSTLSTFVAGLSAAGSVNWALTFGGTSSTLGDAIAVDAAGTVYVAGNFWGTVDFDPNNPGTHVLTNPAYSDMFLLKLKQH